MSRQRDLITGLVRVVQDGMSAALTTDEPARMVECVQTLIRRDSGKSWLIPMLSAGDPRIGRLVITQSTEPLTAQSPLIPLRPAAPWRSKWQIAPNSYTG